MVYICTKDDPWEREKGTPAQHPDAVFVGTCPEGCCTTYTCPHCGKIFTVEEPD